jgi:hypothetical protein
VTLALTWRSRLTVAAIAAAMRDRSTVRDVLVEVWEELVEVREELLAVRGEPPQPATPTAIAGRSTAAARRVAHFRRCALKSTAAAADKAVPPWTG